MNSNVLFRYLRSVSAVMNDLEIAKELLERKQLTLVIVKNGETLCETQVHRISGFLDAIDQYGKSLQEASVADKVVGKAVALLTAFAGVRNVYAETLSAAGRAVLEQNGIGHEWRTLVNVILDDKKQDICPFEKEAVAVDSPRVAYERFKALQRKMCRCR
jgi:hypothetical protein